MIRTTIAALTYWHSDSVTVVARDDGAWAQCTDCGCQFWAHRFDRDARHSKRCDARGTCAVVSVPVAAAEPVAIAAREAMTAAELARASDGAKRDGMVSRRFRSEDDVVEAVRLGYLSNSAAMNRDD